ncbi:MAG: SAVED domain-containing protein [Anaerolineales bacterium]|nr:MAG: SAVED domain-containing protein [Anaerolineales bacterium]
MRHDGLDPYIYARFEEGYLIMAIPEQKKTEESCWSSDHLKWLKDTGERLTTADGISVEVWEFCHEKDDSVLSSWARHFRNHYCFDVEIDYLRKGYGFSRAEYLNKIKFPDPTVAPGPGVRSGDFGEILIADYLEFFLGFWVPRVRYGLKVIADESSKGCDTLGFLFAKKGEESLNDIMVVYETKARLTADQLTDGKKLSGIQAAINGSAKDKLRIAESLNYIKQRFFDKQNLADADRIERFQNLDDRPYTEIYGAAALYSFDSFIPETISSAITNDHPKKDSLRLIIIKGEKIMDLVHELYERAANEA